MKNDKDEQVFTMKKMLPMPKEFTDSDGYNEFGYDWCIAIWGTKWEVINSRISESGDTISVSYLTASDCNAKWVEALCRYLKVMSYNYEMVWAPEACDNYMEGEIIHEPN